MKDHEKGKTNEGSKIDKKDAADLPDTKNRAQAPHTTKGKMTAPLFGSAGSGGAEFEPGPEKD